MCVVCVSVWCVLDSVGLIVVSCLWWLLLFMLGVVVGVGGIFW